MPNSRKADFYLGCLNGSVYIDFNNTADKCIQLCRISFDGFGCCRLDENAKCLNKEFSKEFITEFEKEILNQEKITTIVLELIYLNKDNIWIDALEKYNLIKK